MDIRSTLSAGVLGLALFYLGEDAMETVKKNWWMMIIAGALVIPVLAYMNMKTRKAEEAGGSGYQADDRVQGVKFKVGRDATVFTYQDGTEYEADGLGFAVVTLEDHKAEPERLKAMELKEEYFPVVVFFNHTGFDASGLPVFVRMARNGMQVFPRNGGQLRGYRARLATPLRGGGWNLYFWTTKDTGRVTVSDAEWISDMLNLDPLKEIPKEQLDKMTDEQLKKLNVSRVPKEEAALREKSKTGVRGKVVQVGGVKNPIIPLEVEVHAYKGTEKPAKENLAGKVTSGKDGSYAIALPPGKYVVCVLVDGVLHGNALNPDAYPSMTVPEDEWVDYEFRKGR